MLSECDYYQHDQDESLDTITSLTVLGSVGTPVCLPRTRIPSLCRSRSSSPSNASITTDLASLVSDQRSKSQQRVVKDDGSRIPRRVKSSPAANGNVNSSTGKQRGSFTRSAAPKAMSVASSTILSTACWGGGDGASLDPEVDVWLDFIPLSRKPFKNFHRDFADGVLMAEIMAYFCPKRVDLHNYVSASNSTAKKANYDTLNQKVFSKLGVKLADNLIEGIIHAKPGYIEKALRQVHHVVENIDQRNIQTRAKQLSGMAGSYNGSAFLLAPFAEDTCLVRSVPGEIPDCVIYQNIKYFPTVTVDEISSKVEEQLRSQNTELSEKVRRLETLLHLKENNLQDLTSKIHQLRSKPPEEEQEVGAPRKTKSETRAAYKPTTNKFK